MLDAGQRALSRWPCTWPLTLAHRRSRVLPGKQLLKWHETGSCIDPHQGLAIACIDAHSIAHRTVATLTLLPHSQQRRMACIDEVDDPHIGFAGVFPVQAARVLLQSALSGHGHGQHQGVERRVVVLARRFQGVAKSSSSTNVTSSGCAPPVARRMVGSMSCGAMGWMEER